MAIDFLQLNISTYEEGASTRHPQDAPAQRRLRTEPNIQSRPVWIKFSSLHLSFSLTILVPLYIRILDAINTPTPTRRDKGTTYNYVLLMLIGAVLKAQIDTQHLWQSRRTSTYFHVKFIAAVYDKALKRKDFSGGVSKDADSEDVTHKPNAHKHTQPQTKAE
ncbi:hypothetical protein K438DRAFT_1941919, partial [Mycena galopus ATCC 62051]